LVRPINGFSCLDQLNLDYSQWYTTNLLKPNAGKVLEYAHRTTWIWLEVQRTKSTSYDKIGERAGKPRT
jgi:hypothetical protein